MLFTSQQQIISQLKSALYNGNKYIVLQGKASSGKSRAIKELFASSDFSEMNILIFDRNEANDDEYGPFEKAARKSASIIDDNLDKLFIENREKDYSIAQAIISAGDHARHFHTKVNIDTHFKETERQFLSQINNKLVRKLASSVYKVLKSEKEKKLFFKKNFFQKKFDYAASIQKNIFFFEEINTWDYNSLLLVKKIIDYGTESYQQIDNAQVIITLSDELIETTESQQLIKSILRKSQAYLFNMPPLSDKDFDDLIINFEKQDHCFSIDEKKELLTFLKEYSNDNIEELPYMIEEIHDIMKNKLKSNIGDNLAFYSALKEKLIANNISSDKSEEILEYASLMGNSFSQKEITLVSEINNDQFQAIVQRVLQLRVLRESTELNAGIYKFASNFFQELFKSKALARNDEYHTKLEGIVNILYPYKYSKRARYLSNVFGQEKKTHQLYFLSLLSQLRNRQSLDESIITKLTIEDRAIFNLFTQIYDYLEDNNYKSAILLIEIVKGQSGDITKIVEADLLLALCYSKIISSSNRAEGVKLLEQYRDNIELKTNFSDIYERAMMRLFIMYTHAGMLDESKKLNHTLLELFDSYDIDNKDILIKKNTLLRVSNTIFNEQTSIYLMSNAKLFFDSNRSYSNGIVNLYISLCNLSAIQIENGQYFDSFATVREAELLTLDHPTIHFPRSQILLNNYLLSGYLSAQFEADVCIEMYKNIILSMPINAERLFFVSNLSIFYSLVDNHKTAYEILSKESKIHNTNDDIEGKYNARVSYNLSIFKFLSGDKISGIERMTEYISSLQNSLTGENNREKIRALKALEIMEIENNIINGEDWLDILLKKDIVGRVRGSEVNMSSNNYRKLGFMFTSLYNWDI